MLEFMLMLLFPIGIGEGLTRIIVNELAISGSLVKPSNVRIACYVTCYVIALLVYKYGG